MYYIKELCDNLVTYQKLNQLYHLYLHFDPQ